MDVNEVLKNIHDTHERASEITGIEKNLDFDVGLLTAWDPDAIALPKHGTAREEYFKCLARDNAQVVLNRLYSLEDTEIVEGERVLKMPEPKTILPRAKSVPKPKEPTKWEKFAREKGIKSKSSKTRDNLVWDDAARKWVPRFGYNKVKNDEQKDWLIEIPDQADPNVDYFAKKKEDKKERVAKNKFQQLRNIARARS